MGCQNAEFAKNVVGPRKQPCPGQQPTYRDRAQLVQVIVFVVVVTVVVFLAHFESSRTERHFVTGIGRCSGAQR